MHFVKLFNSFIVVCYLYVIKFHEVQEKMAAANIQFMYLQRIVRIFPPKLWFWLFAEAVSLKVTICCPAQHYLLQTT